jgi:hypothetical protein
MMSSPREFVLFAQVPLGLVEHRNLPKRLSLHSPSPRTRVTHDDDHPVLPTFIHDADAISREMQILA